MTVEFAVGIDFGTTKSHLAFIARTIDGPTPPQFATYKSNARLTPTQVDHPYNRPMAGTFFQPVPTVVAIDKSSEDMHRPRLIPGFKALDREQQGFENFVHVLDLKDRVARSGTGRYVVVGEHEYSVEGLVAHFLWALRKHTLELDEHPIAPHGITITVPAKSGIIQRMTMQFAAAIAGFGGKIDVVEEPVAAFLYHRHIRPDYFHTRRGKPRYALVVDFGGGTCDVAVVRFEEEKLPRVIGRAMGRFGGARIDHMFLRKFWLEPSNGDGLPMNWIQFERSDTSIKSLLLAHARYTKELLAGAVSHAEEVTGAIPGAVGKLIAPRVGRDELRMMLDNDPFVAYYADDREPHEDSLKGHLRTLIREALRDAGIDRKTVGKLILAGGSVQLPSVREWILEHLRTDQAEGSPNEQLQESDVCAQHPDVCVAGGAAIHQLYRHHKTREDWQGAVTSTLSSRFWLIHYRGTSPTDVGEIELGAANEELPIDGRRYWKSKVIHPARRWASGKMELEIGQGTESFGKRPEWRNRYTLPKDFGAKRRGWSWLKAILIRYYIDEFGILQELTCTPGSLPMGWRPGKSFKKFAILGMEQRVELDLTTLMLSNKSRIDTLKDKFIPGSSS